MPYYSYEGERLLLDDYYSKVEETSPIDNVTGLPTKMVDNWNLINGTSIDNLPGLKVATNPSQLKNFRPPFNTYGKDGELTMARVSPEWGHRLWHSSIGPILFLAGVVAGIALKHAHVVGDVIHRLISSV